MNKIGIDLGASHIGIGITDEKGILINKKYILFRNKIEKNYLIDIIQKNIYELLDNKKINLSNIESIGLGLPGGVKKHEGIFYGSKYYMLNIEEFNIKEVLNSIFKKKIYIENDCNCAMLCEAQKGALKNCSDGLMFTLGTGVGISIMRRKNEKIVLGDEIQIKKIIDINNKTYIRSFKNLSRIYEDKIGSTNITRGKIFEDIEAGSIVAKNTLYKYLDNIVEGLNIISKQIQIYNICIGGGFSEYSRYYTYYLKEKLPNFNINTSKYKNDSAIIGATLLGDI